MSIINNRNPSRGISSSSSKRRRVVHHNDGLISCSETLTHRILLLCLPSLLLLVGSTVSPSIATTNNNNIISIDNLEGEVGTVGGRYNYPTPTTSLDNNDNLFMMGKLDSISINNNIFSEQLQHCPIDQEYFINEISKSSKNEHSVSFQDGESVEEGDFDMVDVEEMGEEHTPQAKDETVQKNDTSSSTLFSQYSKAICVNCHALIQIQVMVHGETSKSTSAIPPSNNLLGDNNQWFVSLQEVGGNDVNVESIYMEHALNLSCDQATSLPREEGVLPFTCRSVAKLLVPYSSLSKGMDMGVAQYYNAYQEVVVLASLLRETNTTAIGSSDSSTKRVVDQWLVNVAVPTGRGSSLERGRIKFRNPVYSVKLKDRIYYMNREEASLQIDAGVDWNMWVICMLVPLLLAFGILSIASKFIYNVEEEIEAEEFMEEEAESNNDGNPQVPGEVVAVPEIAENQVVQLGAQHINYSPRVLLDEFDNVEDQDDEEDDTHGLEDGVNDSIVPSDHETDTNELLNDGIDQNEIRRSSQDVFSNTSDDENNSQVSETINRNSTAIQLDFSAAHPRENSTGNNTDEPINNNSGDAEEGQLPIDNNENNNAAGAAEMNLEIYSPQYKPEEEDNAPLPHSNTMSMGDKSEQKAADNNAKSDNALEALSNQDQSINGSEEKSQLDDTNEEPVLDNHHDITTSHNSNLLEDKSSQEQTSNDATVELQHKADEAKESDTENSDAGNNSNKSSPAEEEEELDVQCFHFSIDEEEANEGSETSSNKGEAESYQSPVDNSVLDQLLASSDESEHEYKESSGSKATSGVETSDIEHSSDSKSEQVLSETASNCSKKKKTQEESSEPSPKDANPSVSSSAVTSKIQNGNCNNKRAPSEGLSSQYSFPINRRRHNGKSQQPSGGDLARVSTSPVQDRSSFQTNKENLPSPVHSLSSAVQAIRKMDDEIDENIAKAATERYGMNADEESTSEEEQEEKEEGVVMNPFIDYSAREVGEDSYEEEDDNVDFSGGGDDSSSSPTARLPLTPRTAAHNYMHQNSCPSPSSTVAATVHDERVVRPKLQVKEKPIAVKRGSKKQAMAPSAIFPNLSSLFETNGPQPDQVISSSNVDLQHMISNQHDVEEEEQPRRKSRKEKKRERKIEKRLLATTKEPAVHQPSSGLEPLSQFLVEPTWEAGASSSKVSAESNEKFRSEGPSSEMSY